MTEDVKDNVRNETLDTLKMEYKEVHSYWRTLTDIRFKLLAFVPTLAGLGVTGVTFIPKTLEPLEAFAIGLLGFIVTLGITFYDQRNSQLYNAAIIRAKDLEREMKFRSPGEKEFGGIFCLRPHRKRKFFLCIEMWHDRALAMIYASALGAWLFIIINSILKLIVSPNVHIISGIFSLLLSILLAIVIYKKLERAELEEWLDPISQLRISATSHPKEITIKHEKGDDIYLKDIRMIIKVNGKKTKVDPLARAGGKDVFEVTDKMVIHIEKIITPADDAITVNGNVTGVKKGDISDGIKEWEKGKEVEVNLVYTPCRKIISEKKCKIDS